MTDAKLETAVSCAQQAVPRQRFIIYCHMNRVNGMQYIGRTERTMQQRWAQHVHDAKRFAGCPELGEAIREFGHENFSHEVLDVVTTCSGAKIAERAWIKQRGSRAPDGYNLNSGGGAGSQAHESTRRKISVSTTAQWAVRSNEQRHEIAQRGALSWKTASTPEQRREIARRAAMVQPLVQKLAMMSAARAALAALTPEQRSEKQRQSALKGWARKSTEERRAIALKRTARESFTERRARGLKAWASRSAESKANSSECCTSRLKDTEKRQSIRTSEERSEASKRSWTTRRARHGVEGIRAFVQKAVETKRARRGENACSESSKRSWITRRANGHDKMVCGPDGRFMKKDKG